MAKLLHVSSYVKQFAASVADANTALLKVTIYFCLGHFFSRKHPQQQVAFGETAEGNSNGQQSTAKGSEGSQLGQPIDMAKLLHVSSDVKHLAAAMTDANTALLKLTIDTCLGPVFPDTNSIAR